MEEQHLQQYSQKYRLLTGIVPRLLLLPTIADKNIQSTSMILSFHHSQLKFRTIMKSQLLEKNYTAGSRSGKKNNKTCHFFKIAKSCSPGSQIPKLPMCTSAIAHTHFSGIGKLLDKCIIYLRNFIRNSHVAN